MKKILGISLVAVLAATPLMASASNVTLLGAGEQHTITPTTDVATTSYVQGAYNALGTVINTKADASALTAETTARENADTAINDKIGSTSIGEAGTTITGAIAELQQTVADNDSGMDSRVDALETTVGTANFDGDSLTAAMATLQGDSNTAGSVAAAVAAETALRETAVSNEATARANADTLINNKIGTTTMTTTQQTLTGAIEEVHQAVASLSTDASATYQLKNDSKVADGTYAHITQGTGVAANLVSLNGAVVANDTAITTINNKQIPIVQTWTSGANDVVVNKKISDLTTGS